MHLNYTVMWVDDEINSDGNDIIILETEEYLYDKGFKLIPIRVDSRAKLETELQSYQQIDFIFMDNKFNEEKLGAEFIEKIRNKKIFADIIFYSSIHQADTLKNELNKKDIQGVHIFTKDEVNSNPSYAYDIMNYRIQREMDDMSLRGIGMAMIAEFDKKIFDILDRNLGKDKIIKKVKAKLEERSQDILNKLGSDGYDESLWETLTSNKSTITWDSRTRANSFFSAMRKLPQNSCKHQEDCIIHKGNYDQILEKRNELAHQIGVSAEDALTNSESTSSENHSIKFRQDLINFSSIFSEIDESWK